MVHQYKLNGYNIILDTASGSVHTVDEVAYDIIAMYKTHTKEQIVSEIMAKYGHLDDVNEGEILECLEDIKALEEAGKLFSVDTYEGLATNFKNNSKVIKALCLHVAHTCNLNCSYCFASQGKYQGDKALMSFEVGKRALDFLMENSGSRRNLEVDFFGGEPSLNFDVVKRLVEYAREVEGERGKNFRFTYTTNGMILTDEMIEFLNKECHNVVLSLDGRKEVNDHFRVDYAGKGSYDTIVPNFQRLVESRGGKGLKNYNITAKTGEIAGCCLVGENDDVMLIENGGVIIRIPANTVNLYKRDVQGVIVMRIEEGNQVVSVECVDALQENEV